MKLIDSHKKQLDYAQILHAYHSNEKQSDKRLEDFKVWMTALAAAIAKMQGEGAVIGNTFFLYRRGPEGKENQAMVWAMNADTLQNMTKNVVEFATRMVDMDITDLMAVYESPVVTRVMRQAFKELENPGDTLKFKKLANGMVAMRMNLAGGADV